MCVCIYIQGEGEREVGGVNPGDRDATRGSGRGNCVRGAIRVRLTRGVVRVTHTHTHLYIYTSARPKGQGGGS